MDSGSPKDRRERETADQDRAREQAILLVLRANGTEELIAARDALMKVELAIPRTRRVGEAFRAATEVIQ